MDGVAIGGHERLLNIADDYFYLLIRRIKDDIHLVDGKVERRFLMYVVRVVMLSRVEWLAAKWFPLAHG